MKIGIDGRMWDESGIGRYLRNLVGKLGKLDTKNEYFIFLLKKNIEIDFPKKFNKIEADFKWYGITEQIKFPRVIAEQKLDLMHFPHFNVPILYNRKFIVTIHDLIHQHFDLQKSSTHSIIFQQIKKFGYDKAFKHAVKKSQTILTPSDFVKHQIQTECYIPQEKIVVTPEGVEDNLLTIADKLREVDIRQVLNKFNINNMYLFYIGNAHPHKNLERLINVFSEIQKKYPSLQMVLSGKNSYFWARVLKQSLDGVIYTGFITDIEMVALYKNALCFVMPSLEEGFGIPVLEAMALGTPVVSSNGGSLKEVGGDSAIYFDPSNEADMIKQISRVIGAGELRKELVQKGFKRVKDFSWEKMAKETLEVYESALRF